MSGSTSFHVPQAVATPPEKPQRLPIVANEPVSDEHLRMMTRRAARATSAGNRRVHKLLIVRDAKVIREYGPSTPGMLTRPRP